MTEAIIIRPAALADLPAICRLAVALGHQHVGYDAGRYQLPTDPAAAYAALFTEHIDRPESVLLVAERAGELIGFAFGEIKPPSLVELTGRVGRLHDLYVSPAGRGLGAGGRLLDAAVAGLRAAGCPGGVLLGVAAQNAAAAALFRGRGFRATLQEMTLGS